MSANHGHETDHLPPEPELPPERFVLSTDAGLDEVAIKKKLEASDLSWPSNFSPHTKKHRYVWLRDKNEKRPKALVQMIPAEQSTLATRLPKGCLQSTYVAHPVALDSNPDSRAMAAYLAGRYARMEARSHIFGPKEALNLPNVSGLDVAGRVNNVDYAAIDVQRMTHYGFWALTENARQDFCRSVMPLEIQETVQRGCQNFYKNPYFNAVFGGTLTRAQYIDSVANNHQFVRWTTRLLGQIVGVTSQPFLRRHYIEHLRGEIDHEVLIENDLRHLGADVDYVKDHMVPCVAIQEFIVTEESMAGFHRDPVQFLAVPYAIESLTGFMTKDFIDALKRCIGSWGVENPSKACTFLASHIHFDGGDDGHWEGSRKMFLRVLETERQLQQGLNIVHLVMNSVERAYASYVMLPDIKLSA